MKPALFYTIAKNYGFLELMAVTSIKGDHFYGRNRSGNPTHRLKRDCMGQFKTEEIAAAKIAGVRNLMVQHQLLREPIHAQLATSFANEHRAIAAYVKDPEEQ